LKRLVFIDSGVLIAASRGTDEVAQRAFEVINDPDVDFASSVFVQLETLPKPVYFKRTDEVEFYELFFNNVAVWVEPNKDMTQSALDEASKNGLGAMDALHVAAAIQCGADELITTEKPKAALHHVSGITIRSIMI
jgi:predicted nucleic acid-binding protein